MKTMAPIGLFLLSILRIPATALKFLCLRKKSGRTSIRRSVAGSNPVFPTSTEVFRRLLSADVNGACRASTGIQDTDSRKLRGGLGALHICELGPDETYTVSATLQWG